ncbi:MAG: alpha/beta hydrolase [Burkholderiales bacterium]|nr:alpha/beta hydrolase [Burkholderiales bacterium]
MKRRSFLSLGPSGFHRLAYMEWGDPDNPHVVVCVHGLSRNSRDFDYLAQALSARCRVVCMDVVGRGDSAWLDDKSGYSFSTYLSDAAALIARVTTPPRERRFALPAVRRRMATLPRLDWVGTSMGGLIGMLLAAKEGSPIGRLVLNDVGPFVPWNGLFRLKGHIGRRRSFASLRDARAFLREACVGFGPLREEHWEHLVRNSVRRDDAGGWQLRYDPDIGTRWPTQPDPELPIGPEFLRGIDLWTVWNAVRCPVLVLRGADSDVLLEGTVEEMRRRKPDTQVVQFPGVGHVPALYDKAQIDAVRSFVLDREAATERRRAVA